MREKPLISVIIPVYNVEKYLNQCLQSIVMQTYQNIEVILVDDGSSDASGDICDRYALMDYRFKVFHQQNEGVVSARLKAFAMSEGQYISCVDSDDWIDLNCYEKISEVIKLHDPDMVCFGICYENGQYSKLAELPERKGLYNRLQIEEEIFPTLIQSERATYFSPNLACKVIRRCIFEENQFSDRKTIVGEDGACSIGCVYSSNRLFIMPDCMYHYRYNALSATNRKQVYNWDGPYSLYEHIQKKIPIDAFDFSNQLDRKVVHGLFNVALSQFYRRDSVKNIFTDLKKNLYSERYLPFIKRSLFRKSYKALIMHAILKYRMLFFLFMINRLKK